MAEQSGLASAFVKRISRFLINKKLLRSPMNSYLAECIYKVVLLRSISTQICQLIPCISNSKG